MVEREQRPGGQEKQIPRFVSHEGSSSGKEKSSPGVQAAHPLPSRSSLTDFPDLTRFPDTFGYPAIWGGSGKDEPPSAEGAEDDPPEARRTVEEWSALTKTWNNISKETVMKIRARTPEGRKRWEQIILEDMRLMEQVEEERSPETEAEDAIANEQAHKSWEELFAKEGAICSHICANSLKMPLVSHQCS